MTVTSPEGALDSIGMFDLAAGLPEQVEDAIERVQGLDGVPDLGEVENVVVLGMGGSGAAGDVVAAVAAPFMAVPLKVIKGYEAPSFIGEGTLCFAISYSGATEETIEAAQEAAVAGARMVCISNGGPLAELSASWEAPHVGLPDIPMPRAGLGALAVPPLLVLEAVGLFPGARQYVEDAVSQLKRRRDSLVVPGNPAEVLARRIGRTMPLAYGGGELGAVAARRFKNQCNENAKVPAFTNAYPELCHNEICGWGQNGDVTRQVLTVVELRHDFEHPQVMRRFELTRDRVAEAVAGVEELRAEGEGALAQLFDLILQGDFASLHLAAELGVDPGPVPVLDELKAELGA